ncbi:MAG: hypothetical protein BWY05_01390 [Euryarchaeota archaeon ADurb.Bin165]|nr:MAG: hypothetical protein BWY05_01390 [Euryarchaeota archaeon ADurb.Bin165]
MILSLTCAAPLPLISLSSGSNWSAPSIAISIFSTCSRPTRGIPRAMARMVVCMEVGTPQMDRPSSVIRSFNLVIMYATVEPVPRPMVMPLMIYSAAL